MEPARKRHRGRREPAAEEEASKEEEAPEVQIAMGDDGRVALYGGTPPDYSFQSFPSFVELSDDLLTVLRRDCETAFTARAAKGGKLYSRGETFWVPAHAAPKSLLESLALRIFQLHAGKAGYDALRSGAEWWTQVIDAEDDIGWHWDRDYSLEADADHRLHPHLASVTYLSDLGAPTVIVEAAEENGPATEDSARQPLGIPAAHISRATPGKHVCFDGRWLHAAPAELAAMVEPAGATLGEGKRYTFLVNVWLNYVPLSTVPFPSPLALSPRSGKLPMVDSPIRETLARTELKDDASVAGVATSTWDFGARDDDAEDDAEEEEPVAPSEGEGEGDAGGTSKAAWRVHLPLPLTNLQASKPGDSISIGYGPGLAKVEPLSEASA